MEITELLNIHPIALICRLVIHLLATEEGTGREKLWERHSDVGITRLFITLELLDFL